MKRLLTNKNTITIISIILFALIMLIPIIFIIGFVNNTSSDYQTENSNNVDTTDKGKCLEYKTTYKLDCGFFTCSDSFCCERKYDECVKWENEI